MRRAGTRMIVSRSAYAAVAIVTVLSLLGGCAKFRASRRVEAGPFAENITVLVGDVQSDLVGRKPFYIEKYLDGPNLAEYRREWNDLRTILRGIVLYSTHVVNVAQSPMNERKKPNALAGYLRELLNPVIESKDPDLRITKEQLDRVLRNVEIQTSLLSALREAQPLIDKIALFADGSFDRIHYLLDLIVQDVNERMAERWAETRMNVQSLMELQNRTIRSYALLYQYREGDPQGLDALRANDPALRPVLCDTGTPGEKKLDAVEARIMARVQNLAELGKQLSPQVQQYLLEARERDELLHLNQEAGKKLRTTVLLWARSHRNLGAGIPVPPEIDLYNVLVGSAQKMLPVP